MVILFYHLLWYTYNLYQIKIQSASIYKINNLVNLLKKDNINLLCLSNNESYSFLRYTKVNIIGFFVNISLEGKYEHFFKNFFTQYPLVNSDIIENLCEDYHITHIIQNRNTKEHDYIKYNNILKKMNGFHRLYVDDKYELYEKKPD